ncbi:GNAT family N-acetyltransferase [Roseovarius sp. C7]|uniref:GNAT family N-acetyltransferase n=1 Tax=Roseovarius sp. C7 TaxID=3398643 RepID=UPI0039F5E5A2
MQMHRRHFLDQLPLPMQQHWLYGRALSAMGRSVGQISFGNDAAAPLGHAQWVERRFGPLRLRWLGRGPVWAKSVPTQYRRDTVASQIAASPPLTGWLISPAHPDDLPRSSAIRLTAPGADYALALSDKPDDMLAAMHGKWRNRLRRAQRDDLPLHHRAFDPLRDKPLLELENLQRTARGYTALPAAFTLGWARAAPRTARLFLAGDPSDPLAFMLVLRHGTAASYHLGWSGPRGRQLSAHNLLLWSAMTHLAATGTTTLSLGPTSPRHPAGLHRFKTGTGAQIRRIEPTYLLGRRPSMLLPLAFRRHPV